MAQGTTAVTRTTDISNSCDGEEHSCVSRHIPLPLSVLKLDSIWKTATSRTSRARRRYFGCRLLRDATQTSRLSIPASRGDKGDALCPARFLKQMLFVGGYCSTVGMGAGPPGESAFLAVSISTPVSVTSNVCSAEGQLAIAPPVTAKIIWVYGVTYRTVLCASRQ